jgi:glycerol-3-phosphate acyltransferase PlsY
MHAMNSSLPDLWSLSVVVPFLIGAYFFGSVPYGWLLVQWFSRTDVRKSGSGNIGATNVARVAGRKIGLLTLALDVAKGATPVLLCPFLPVPPELVPGFQAWTGLAAFGGHCFPVWLRFKGGKGVATGLGVLLAHIPLAAALGGLVFAAVFAASRFVSLGSLGATIGVMIGYFVFYPDDLDMLPLVLMWIILVAKHRSNLVRLVKRQEMRI